MDFLTKFLGMAADQAQKRALAAIPTHWKKSFEARLQDQLGLKGISANHDLVRAVRLAWIEAALHILAAAEKLSEEADWRGERAAVRDFAALCRSTLASLRDAAFDRGAPPAPSPIDADLHSVMRGVPEFVAPDAQSDVGRDLTARFSATLAALTGWRPEDAPPVFQQVATTGLAARGGAMRPFGELVFAAFAELIKDPQKYPQAREAFYIAIDKLARDLGEATLAAARAANVRLAAQGDALAWLRTQIDAQVEALPRLAADVAAVRDDAQAIRTAQADHGAMLTELLAIARQGGAFQRAAAEGIPEAAVRAIVERLGGEGVAGDQLIAWLDSWIETARRELSRQSNESAAFEAARREAEDRFRGGRLADASAAFMDALARDEAQEEERQTERRRRRLRLLEEAVRFDELALDADAAADKLTMMAQMEGAADADALGAWLNQRARDYMQRGFATEDNASHLIAIALFERALTHWTRAARPRDWASLQNGLGCSLGALGALDSTTARLDAAALAFRRALEIRSPQLDRKEWAGTQRNLGHALGLIGERSGDMRPLEDAVKISLSALDGYDRDESPREWADAHNDLGNAYASLGLRAARVDALQESVAAYRRALAAVTRAEDLPTWSMLRSNLARALTGLARHSGDGAGLPEAVSAARDAVEVADRALAPLSWAVAQNGLGAALFRFAQHAGGVDALREAVICYRAALDECSPTRAPLEWGMATGNLGEALVDLALRESDPSQAAEGIALLAQARDHFLDAGHAPFAKDYGGKHAQVRARAASLTNAKKNH